MQLAISSMEKPEAETLPSAGELCVQIHPRAHRVLLRFATALASPFMGSIPGHIELAWTSTKVDAGECPRPVWE